MAGTAFNALVDGYVATPNPGPLPTDNNAGATQGAVMGPNVSAGVSANTSASVGSPPYTGMHNTPLHVAFLGLLALGIIILLRRAGFRFSAVGKLGVGRG